MELIFKILFLFTYFCYGIFGGLLFHRIDFSFKRFFLYFFFLFLFCYIPGMCGLVGLSFLNILLFKGDYFSSLLLSVIMNFIQICVKIFFYFFLDSYVEIIFSSNAFHFDQFRFQVLSLFIACIILVIFKKIINKGMSGFTSCILLLICMCFQVSYLLISHAGFKWIGLVLILCITNEYFLREKVLVMEKDSILSDQINFDYRKKVHENKNHLLLIKSMDYKEDITNYVDHLLGSKNNDSNYWIHDLEYLHLPGIKEFLNFKLDELSDMGATIELFVSDELDKIQNINTSHFYDLSTIIGILLDNIKDSIQNMDDKLVSIQFYLDENILHGEFINRINEDIEIDSIFNKGYSTKGKNRGVGLSIVSEIISNNSFITCTPKILDNLFMMDVAYQLPTKNH